ncbi:MAG TPA: autotransporter outer membrane beta-barrel domain-containing protein, partial [Pseudomonas sp.]|nr:autotransporter outer membrane beta-barrel domain-containing protein [Pseudomonas sp.]
TLAEDTGAVGAMADMSAQLTGTGGLNIEAGAGIVSLSNTTNDYQGATSVLSGTLRADADNALGQTSLLSLASATSFDLNGKTQTVGALDTQVGSTLDMHGGTLNLSNGGTAAGSLTGAGLLNVDAGTLQVQGANSTLSANTTIASGATVNLADAAGLGSGAISNAGTLELDGATGALVNAISGAGLVNLLNGADVTATGNNTLSSSWNTAAGTRLTVSTASNLGTAQVHNAGTFNVDSDTDWTLNSSVDGSGDLTKNGTGTLTAGNSLTYSGKTAVMAGTLLVGDASQPGVTLGGAGAGQVTVAQGATLAGLGTVSGQVLNAGTLAALNTLPGHTGDPAGVFTLNNGLVNSGMVNLAGASIGNELLVKGDYQGNGGTVVLQTFMGDDGSATDKLVIDGGRATGDTALVIKHGGGAGAQTNQGIRVVETRNGASTAATAFNLSSASDGYRAGSGTLASGAYDYRLARGGVGGSADDWYLVSQGSSCATNAALCSQSYRPEVGSYLNNKLFAQTMQTHSLRDRQNQAQSPDMASLAMRLKTGMPVGMTNTDPTQNQAMSQTPETLGMAIASGLSQNQGGDSNAWLRVVGSSVERTGAGDLDLSDDRYVVHAGSDLLHFSDGAGGRIHIGAMAMYGESDNDSDNGELSSSGTVEGYNLGMYATWYAQTDYEASPYVDTWVMYGQFDNEVHGKGLAAEHYDSTNLSASVEVGHPFSVYENSNSRIFVEPQAQVIVSQYDADDHTEANGTAVSDQADTSTTTRLGVQVRRDVTATSGLQLRPFASVNWWHGPDSQSIAFDDVKVREEIPSDRIEGRVGVQGDLGNGVSMMGAVGFETGDHDYSARSLQLEVRYVW